MESIHSFFMKLTLVFRLWSTILKNQWSSLFIVINKISLHLGWVKTNIYLLVYIYISPLYCFITLKIIRALLLLWMLCHLFLSLRIGYFFQSITSVLIHLQEKDFSSSLNNMYKTLLYISVFITVQNSSLSLFS